MKYLLLLFALIIILSFCYKMRVPSWGQIELRPPAPQQGDIYAQEYRNGILFVNIKDNHPENSVNTRASIYSKYVITQLDPHYILLDSSDIGMSIITDKISSKWDTYGAKHITLNGYDVYIVLIEPRSTFQMESDGILVLFKRGDNIKTFRLEGKFHLELSPYSVGDDYLSISTKLHTYNFKAIDTISLTVNQ